jgi:hypothetical protein
MIELTDEILNSYIDGDLSTAELNEVKKLLDNSEEARRRLNALQLVDRELKNYPLKDTSSDFTSVLMKKIMRKPEVKGQKYFIFSVSSFFILISLGIIGYITSYILSAGGNSTGESSSVDKLIYISEQLVMTIKKFFTAGNVSVIGFIFSFAIIISAYFFFDSHKQAKAKLTKL